MRIFQLCQAAFAASLFSASTLAAPSSQLKSRVANRTSCHSPTNRACWTTDGFGIDTDYEEHTPLTGVVRKYTFNLTEHDDWVGPEGVKREKVMLINNQYPGPTIRGDWGDSFEVTVINNLQTNGTGIHWHGIRQLNSNVHDGTPGVTECPIPPGSSMVYKFTANQYGTSWYHTHYSSQYAYGIMGMLIIDGPASLPYDIDLGPFPIFDTYYESPEKLLRGASDPHHPYVPGIPGSPPPSENILFNGTNINPSGPGGEYAKVKLTPGKRHRLRLVNPSVENVFSVSIVGHKMTVMAIDFVPVNAYTTDRLFMTVGQRYDVTIDASQPVGNYWINATMSKVGVCGACKNPYPAAILSYEGAPNENPTDPGAPEPESYCSDNIDYEPVVKRTAPAASFVPDQNSTLDIGFDPGFEVSKVTWLVDASSIDVQWEKPVLQYLRSCNKTVKFPDHQNIIHLPETNKWSIWLIQNPIPVPHPMHLHGHDILFLGRSEPPKDPLGGNIPPQIFNPVKDGPKLRADNPMRRDTYQLPALGWAVIAFRTDNPGAWLMHCHIAWHASQGLSVDFLERASDIKKSMNLHDIADNCKAWKAYMPFAPPKLDSGI